MTETVILTCLPNGFTGDGRPRLTIFVTPRLVAAAGGGKLEEFPAFSNWPESVLALGLAKSFSVEVEESGAPPDAPLQKIGATFDPSPIEAKFWPRLFQPGLTVFAPSPGPGAPGAGFQDFSGQKVRSFPAADLADQIAGMYSDVAKLSGSSFPSINDAALATLKKLGPTSLSPQAEFAKIDKSFSKEVEAGIEGVNQGGGYFHLPAGDDAKVAQYVLARRFYDRPGQIAKSPSAKPDIDFHGYVGFLGDYPLLLRKLGLAFDLFLDEKPPELGKIRLIVDPPQPNASANPPIPNLSFTAEQPARPWTNYRVGGHRFHARSREQEETLLADGSFRFEQAYWFSVQQLDVDGSALKGFDFAGTMAKISEALKGGQPSTTTDRAALPALRTGGFVVAQRERDKAVVNQLTQAAGHAAKHAGNKPADLYAEDVTRGIRPQVLRVGDPPWRSLVSRDGDYLIAEPPLRERILDGQDEGFVKGASATSAMDGSDDDLYLHESLFGWDGWSLAVKRPGQAILDSGGEKVDLADPNQHQDSAFPLQTSFSVPGGSLPRLRFGKKYRFRAQAVDLAGNSVDVADLAEHSSAEHTFRRWDPIPSPAIVPRRRFTEGESLTRLVIRSTLDLPPGAYVAQARIKNLAHHTNPGTAYLVENHRWIAAPKASVQLAEWHGKLDDGIGTLLAGITDANVNTAFKTASRESGSYMDPTPEAEVVTNDGNVPGKPLTPAMKGHALGAGEYVIHDTDHLLMPYLPDPAAAGATFTTLPGDATTRPVYWRGGDWPDWRPIELRIVDGGLTTDAPTSVKVGPKLDANGDPIADTWVVTVALRQAEMVVVRLSCRPAPDQLDVFAVLAPSTALSAPALADFHAGRNWLVTPYEEITLVHAVEMPLTKPIVNVVDAGVQRYQGETFAVLGGTIDNHAKSTGRIDIEASWTDPIDDPVKEAPNDLDNLGEVPGQGHAGDFMLEATEDKAKIGRDDVPPSATQAAVHKVRHEFRDTRHRFVSYEATATTRFREYFPSDITNDRKLVTSGGPTTTVSIPSSRRPDPPDVQYVIPTFRWVDDVYPGYSAGTSITEVDPTIARAFEGIRGARRLLDRGFRAERVAIPAHLRLPLVHRRVRKAGLRVYLGRPWYSSGADELLAVVLPDQPYLLWAVDLVKGMMVEASAKAYADEVAEHVLSQGLLRAAGGARLRPSERLARGVETMRPRAADAADQPFDTAGFLSEFQGSLVSEVLATLPEWYFRTSGDPEKFVTRFGADPIWGSDPPADGPWIHQFPLRTQVDTGLSLLEAPGNTVAAVGHRPRFDKDRGLWYCDIDIDAGTSYFPFVRLGLARYQPSSIPGVHLSRVVTPEWAQLMPDRTATLGRPRPSAARVSLRGPAGYSSVAKSVYGQAAGSEGGLELSRFAVAQVERLPAKATTDLAWQAAGPEVRLELAVRTAYSDIEYGGLVEVPGAREGEQLRLTLREYEVLETDQSEADSAVFVPGSTETGPFGIPTSYGLPSTLPVRFRLVYASHLAL